MRLSVCGYGMHSKFVFEWLNIIALLSLKSFDFLSRVSICVFGWSQLQVASPVFLAFSSLFPPCSSNCLFLVSPLSHT